MNPFTNSLAMASIISSFTQVMASDSIDQQLMTIKNATQIERQAMIKELKTELQAWISRVIARENVSADCIASVEVRHGHPVGEILKSADACAADLVVLGSHGKGRLQTFLLGSVAEQVLHRLRRSALVVPVSQP